MNFVIGGRGRLGRSLLAHLPPGTIALERSSYAGWTEPGSSQDVARFFEPYAGKSGCVFVAAGVIDPKRPAEEHQKVNVNLPQNIVDGAGQHGLRVITFGTIMEEIAGPASANPYFDSKLKLGGLMREAGSRGADVLHVRIHTLYGGGAPDRFMFLGQLLEALRNQEIFRMSGGTQLREYHHIEDEVAAISVLAQSGIRGAVNLNHGAPVRLVDLAAYVFDRFGCADRLHVGAIPSAATENHTQRFERPPVLKDARFRDSLESVFEYIKVHMANA